jgi:hypothetical protein
MTAPIPINLVVEDVLSEAVLRTILRQLRRRYAVGTCFSQGGFGYIRKTIRGFNNAAKGTPFLVLTDLDKTECPPVLINEWLSDPKHPNLLFRVAVREVEAWILAHREAFAKFVGIRKESIPQDLDTIDDPKQLLINLASKSRYRELREAIVPPSGSTAKVGPDYNGRLITFVKNYWKAQVAMRYSPSLHGTMDAVTKFKPT